jgi:hypothetical protein
MTVETDLTAAPSVVSLYWIPLGAGGRCVRLSGGMFELATALRQHRRRCVLYHSALEVVAWLLERAGIGTAHIGLPPGGRAPGWDAGVAIARRE